MKLLDRRTCEGCTECCTWVGVEEIGKDCAQPCQFEVMGGCGIYDARPEMCAGFYCLWRAGFGRDDDRPDHAGWFVCQADKIRNQERVSLTVFGALDKIHFGAARTQLREFAKASDRLCTIDLLVFTDAKSTHSMTFPFAVTQLPPDTFAALGRMCLTYCRTRAECPQDKLREMTVDEAFQDSLIAGLSEGDAQLLANGQLRRILDAHG